LDLDYYKKAISKMSELTGVKTDDTLFVIFSDDINWCKENFTFLIHTNFINEKDYVEMFIMSRCEHNIIANSSFSWWSAFLNTNPNKKVIYPSKWFLTKNLNTKDLHPKSWVSIQN
jgi:hypothetical protein